MERRVRAVHPRAKKVVVRLCKPFATIVLELHTSCQFLPKYNAFTESSLGKGTKHDSWQLQLLGTKPDCQQKGLATALIKFVRDKVCSRRVEGLLAHMIKFSEGRQGGCHDVP